MLYVKGEFVMRLFNPDAQPAVTHIFPPTVEIILTIVIAVIIILFLRLMFKDLFQTMFSKTKTVSATLVSKVAEPYVTKKVYAAGGAGTPGVASGVAEKGMDYYFTFQLEDGKVITLQGPKTLYDVALEEGHGTLSYKGKRFISYDGPTEGTRVKTDQNDYEFVGLNKKL